MYRLYLVALILPLSLWGVTLQANDSWNQSKLSVQTMQKLQQQTRIYHQCLDRGIVNINTAGIDSRDASNKILKQCETQLEPIRQALLAEKVPADIAQRYLLRKRHQAARKVLKLMMFAQSQQVGR